MINGKISIAGYAAFYEHPLAKFRKLHIQVWAPHPLQSKSLCRILNRVYIFFFADLDRVAPFLLSSSVLVILFNSSVKSQQISSLSISITEPIQNIILFINTNCKILCTRHIRHIFIVIFWGHFHSLYFTLIICIATH